MMVIMFDHLHSSIRLAEREDVLRMKEADEASFQEECLTG